MAKREQITQEGGAVVFFVILTIWLLLMYGVTLGVLR